MSKLALEMQLGPKYERYRLVEILRSIEVAVNQLAEGKIVARYTSSTAAPTSTRTSYDVGDTVYNSNPSELGSAPNKYVLLGWICVAAGSPGTWKEMRVLTGN